MTKDEWKFEGACCSEYVDPEIFYPETADQLNKAKLVCAQCDVIDDCLQAAIKTNESFGVWGGLDSRERAYLAKRYRSRKSPRKGLSAN